MTGNNIIIKGTGDGLLVILGEGEWDGLVTALGSRLAGPPAFFRGGQVVLQVGERALSQEQLRQVDGLLQEHGMLLRTVVGSEATTQAAAEALGLHVTASLERRAPSRTAARSDREAMPGVVMRRTLRSGQAVRHSGHVVVIGDVNPGAEIVATGDVVVWGRLRGMVHAGAHGDESAIVCALQLVPTQLRIGDHIARPPDDAGRSHVLPELARVQDGRIVVEALRQNDDKVTR